MIHQKYSKDKFKILFENSPIGMGLIDQETGDFLEVNQYLLDLTGYTKKEFLNLSFWDLTPQEYERQELQQIEDLNNHGKFGPNEKEYIRKDGTRFYIKISGFSLIDENDKKVVWGLIEDISQKKQYEIIYKDNKDLLEYIAIENNLQKILDKIVHLAEKRASNMKCSILLLDKKGKHLLSGSAPSLPDFYNEAINGIEIGETIGSCGKAAFTQKRVIVENINTSKNWQAYLELTNEANLHACWSEPIFSSNNKVLGTFAIYNTVPKHPNKFELMLIETYANIASKAIEKHNNTQLIQEKEYKLEEKQLLLKNILSAIPDVIYFKDIQGTYLVCNPEIEKFFGVKEPDIIGKTDYDLVDKEVADAFRQDDLKALNSDKVIHIEEWVSYADNSKNVLLDTAKTAIRNSKDEVIGVLGICHDVTNREEKNKEIVRNKKKLDEVLEASGEGIWDWNIQTNHVEHNNKWYEILGLNYNEDMLDDFTKLIHSDDRDKVLKKMNDVLNSTSTDYQSEHRLIKKDGSVIWVIDKGRIVEYDEDNNPLRLAGSFSDITERKNIEYKLAKQTKKLVNSEKLASMGEMIANIAHQWRQPLSVISTGATGMKVQKEYGLLDDNSFNNTCDLINEHAQYLSKTIDDFKNFIKGERTKKIFNLTDDINSFLHLVEGTIKKDNIILVLNLDDKIEVNGYENELIQCFINIFNNAKDALAGQEIKERLLFITTIKDTDNIIIKIKDNATGIPKNILPNIFEPYFTTKHKSQGTGLGLSMTYSFIVDGMNGNIEVENINFEYNSVKYKGAEFTITLPF